MVFRKYNGKYYLDRFLSIVSGYMDFQWMFVVHSTYVLNRDFGQHNVAKLVKPYTIIWIIDSIMAQYHVPLRVPSNEACGQGLYVFTNILDPKAWERDGVLTIIGEDAMLHKPIIRPPGGNWR